MEKIIAVSGKVDDLYGLIIDLKKAGFAVRNVGVENFLTRVYLEPGEEKDPTVIVESWIGKATPANTETETWQRRARELKELTDKEQKSSSPEVPVQKKISFLGRIFRKILG